MAIGRWGMTLLVDAGNSRIKWRLDAQEGVCRSGSVSHRGRAPVEVLRAAWRDLPAPSAVYVACVAGEGMREAIAQVVGMLWPVAVLVFLASRPVCCGVRVAYEEPARFGVDRLAALVAAFSKAQGRAVVVLDAGTAVTLDALDARGRHLGGLIMPGRLLLQAALRQGTAEVETASAEEMGHDDDMTVLQTSTQAAVRTGARLMWLGGVEHALQAVRARMPADTRIVLTGGDADEILASIELGVEVLPDLVLEGVALMAAEVASATRFAHGAGMA